MGLVIRDSVVYDVKLFGGNVCRDVGREGGVRNRFVVDDVGCAGGETIRLVSFRGGRDDGIET